MAVTQTNTNKVDPLIVLPPELGLEVLSHLDVEDLWVCCLVNKKWHAFASDNGLWRSFWNQSYMGFPPERSLKQAFTSRAIRSIDELLMRLEMFANRIEFGDQGEFYCNSLEETQLCFSAKLQVRSTSKPKVSKLEEVCVFVETFFDELVHYDGKVDANELAKYGDVSIYRNCLVLDNNDCCEAKMFKYASSNYVRYSAALLPQINTNVNSQLKHFMCDVIQILNNRAQKIAPKELLAQIE